MLHLQEAPGKPKATQQKRFFIKKKGTNSPFLISLDPLRQRERINLTPDLPSAGAGREELGEFFCEHVEDVVEVHAAVGELAERPLDHHRLSRSGGGHLRRRSPPARPATRAAHGSARGMREGLIGDTWRG